MDIIDNFNKLTLGKYIEIQEVCKDDSLEAIEQQAHIIAILAGQDVDEILHLPIGEYKSLVAKTSFLDPDKINNPDNIKIHPVAKKYLVGDFELIPVKDYRKLETCQYVDFQTFAQDLDKYLVEFLSVILVPKGHRYNEGYDILEVQQALRDEMSVTDGVSLAGFFLTWCKQSILNSLNYSKQMVKGIKNRSKREKMLREIQVQENLLRTNGVGSPM